jgi:hypothetical protein
LPAPEKDASAPAPELDGGSAQDIDGPPHVAAHPQVATSTDEVPAQPAVTNETTPLAPSAESAHSTSCSAAPHRGTNRAALAGLAVGVVALLRRRRGQESFDW